MFAPFLAADGLTVKDFVHREVEPLDKEVEQIQIMAVCQAIDIPLKVAYLDRSAGALNFHEILEAHPKVRRVSQDQREMRALLGAPRGVLSVLTHPRVWLGERDGQAAESLRMLYRPGHYDIMYAA